MSLRPSDQRLSPPPLAPADFRRLDAKLANARLRRRATLEPLLLCKIDGQVKAEVDLRRESQSAPMLFSAGDDCLEVWANDVLLATYFLPHVDDLEPGRTLEEAITLEGGQCVVFQCSLIANKEGELACRALVRYRETKVSRIIARQWRRWMYCEWWKYIPIPRPIAATLILAVFAIPTDLVIPNLIGEKSSSPSGEAQLASGEPSAQHQIRQCAEGMRYASQSRPHSERRIYERADPNTHYHQDHRSQNTAIDKTNRTGCKENEIGYLISDASSFETTFLNSNPLSR